MHRNCEKNLFRLVYHNSGRKKNDCAIVIPSANAVELLEDHLSLLAKQTTRDFDVIIIGEAPNRAPTGLNLIIYKEKYPLGSSGGFGLGRLLAHSLGYDCIMNADIDCFPVSSNLVKKLEDLAKAEQKMVVPFSAPNSRCMPDESTGKPGGSTGYGTNQYGAVPRSVLERSGFEYFRLFKGAEDHELFERLGMDDLLLCTNEVRVLHKSQLFDYIALLKFHGNKYIYYKKSAVIAKILLTSYALRKGMPVRAVKYALDAYSDVIKTQLFYSNYPDITKPVYEALFLGMDGVSVARTTSLAIFKPPAGAKKLVLSFGEKAGEQTLDFTVGTGTLGKMRLLTILWKAVLSDADYFEPTEKFLKSQARFFPILLMIKPMRYSDGIVYSSGMAGWQAPSNAIKTALLSPFIILVLLSSIIKAGVIAYPAKLENLEDNLLKFLEYVKKFQLLQER